MKEQIADLKKICNSWTKSTKMTFNCIERQIPHQVKAILDGDFKTAASLSNFQFGSVNKDDFEGLGFENKSDDEVSSNEEFDELIENELQERKDQIPVRPMGRVPPPAVYHDPKKKGMIIADVAKRPQNWNKPMIFKKQQHLAGTPPP